MNINAPVEGSAKTAAGHRGFVGYQPFVDGLRAVSILLVVAYHAAPRWVPGGFVGVDVFFVISGFLIIGQVVAEARAGAFSFGSFWSRRALRILPPYLLVLAATLGAALWIFLVEREFAEYGRTLATAALMLVNIRFALEDSYFAPGAEETPLLHTWSLAVEEQFYVLGPLLVVAIAWLAPRLVADPARRLRLVVALVAALALASFGACLAAGFGIVKAQHAFYLMPMRAWEFIAGAAIALALPRIAHWPRWLAELAPIAGLAAIAAGGWAFFGTAPYPDWRVAMVVAGAALVIAGGLARPSGAAARLLASPPMVGIGLISYAWYLWHWPLLSFAAIYDAFDLYPWLPAVMVALSFVLAVATYLAVERPVRRWRARRAGPLGWRPAIVGTAISLAMAGVGAWLGYAYKPASAGTIDLPAVSFADVMLTDRRDARACAIKQGNTPQGCNAEAAGARYGLVLGDSHAIAVFPMLQLEAEERGLKLATMYEGACNPIVELTAWHTMQDPAQLCVPNKQAFQAWLADPAFQPEFVIVAANWAPYLFDATAAGPNPSRLVPIDGGPEPQDQHRAFVDGLRGTIERLEAKGVRRVLVVRQFPSMPRDAPTCLGTADRLGIDRDSVCSATRAWANDYAARPAAWLGEALGGRADVRIIDPMPVFCDTDWCRAFDETQRVLYLDTHHVSDHGAEKLFSAYRADVDWVMGAGDALTDTAISRARDRLPSRHETL